VVFVKGNVHPDSVGTCLGSAWFGRELLAIYNTPTNVRHIKA